MLGMSRAPAFISAAPLIVSVLAERVSGEENAGNGEGPAAWGASGALMEGK